MKKNLGIFGLLTFVCVLTALFSEGFLSDFNIENLIRRTALFGIISIGVALVIITAGIDLSIGSVVCLVGCLVPWLLVDQGWGVPLTLLVILLVSLGIGLLHGLLITKLKLQPFVVTLCGLLIYRGVTRGFLDDQTTGFKGQFDGLRQIALGVIPLPGTEIGIPVPCLILLVVAIGAAVFLNLTIYGRYLLALGRNEEAARYSGINTDRMIILAYVLCSLLAGLGGLLFVCDVGSAQPVDFGNFYELYAIAAAVLGGCSLRGGEGSILGVILGTAVMRVLKNSITMIDQIPNKIEFAVIGLVILGGVAVDELLKRYAARRRVIVQARADTVP
ncbi:ABC transporter permease [Adhaeretor mobilis]|uniref:Ribose transport system permease protein RbsC n=1 Tax=Adhaeretor mobilis TaxID=1930276 RepID=A0A517MTW9_9BACT|nr:ABC transporter permease [Adhaeretor mobilis]QDS98302.1 Ribose transport system permease protein RbsC [Adhaeretor mobilis]